MKMLNIFYFDNDLGDFDEFNPRFVMEQKYAKKVLTLISQKPKSYYSKSTLENKLRIKHSTFENVLKLLSNVSAINFTAYKINLNFPFFNNFDVKIIKNIITRELRNSSNSIATFVNKTKNILINLFPDISAKLSTYHILCGQIFDGKMFDYLNEKKIIKHSFAQNKSRDYLMIGYENSFRCNTFNKNLYCSFNHSRCQNESLSSFGNANGERFDMFRYLKLKDINKLHGKFKTLDALLSTFSNHEIISGCLKTIKSLCNGHQEFNNIYTKVLIKLNYLNKNKKIIVPVFFDYQTKIDVLFNMIKKDISDVILESFNRVKKQLFKSNLYSIKNKINEYAISNELWHIYFGLLNKMLIDKKLVAKPNRFNRQGKYLKCIYLQQKSIE